MAKMHEKDLAARLQALEELTAHQARQIDELSQTVADQWKRHDVMKRKLDTLTQRFLALEEVATPAPPITKPPHY